MFENLSTAIVQAIGFFGVFAFFVYQLLSNGEKPIKTQLKSPRKKVNETKDFKINTKKKGIFGRKEESIEVLEKTRKKGIFGRKEKPLEVLEKTKKKGWFK